MKENGYVETQCARSSCKKPVYGSYWIGFDHQKGYEQRVFCSKECLKSWTIGKLVGMCVAVFLGFALMNAFLQEGNPEMAAIIVFIPYMLRQIGVKLLGIFDSGVFLTMVTVIGLLFASVTVVYPVYKIIRETVYYIKTLRQLKKV